MSKMNPDFTAVKQQIMIILNSVGDSDGDKAEAIYQAIEKFSEHINSDLVQRTVDEARRAASDEQYAKNLNLRVLNNEEVKFYNNFKNLRQAISAEQVDIIPSTIIDNTLVDIKKQSGIFDLIVFSPANVKKWISAAKSGVAVWGGLTAALTAELSATITGLNMDLHKLHAMLLIPKAIRELSLPFVDRYFMAVLKEVMNDGIVTGFLFGDGVTAPIGIFRTVATGHALRTLSEVVTGFTPKLLAPVKKHLTAGGKRTYSEIYLVCNPADEADYVDPALYDAEGRMVSSYKNLKVIADPNCTAGKAAFVVKGLYTMGFSGFVINEYKETKAIDDVDVIIAKVYGNGRPVDDYVSYVFDVTKLVEYVPLVKSQTVA